MDAVAADVFQFDPDSLIGCPVHHKHKTVFAGKRPQPYDVIPVFVGNEDCLDILRSLIDLTQGAAYVAHTAASIHQDARLIAAEEMAVTRAATRQ
jgi:hypothetical protein